jgi:hypothetical protein
VGILPATPPGDSGAGCRRSPPRRSTRWPPLAGGASPDRCRRDGRHPADVNPDCDCPLWLIAAWIRLLHAAPRKPPVRPGSTGCSSHGHCLNRLSGGTDWPACLGPLRGVGDEGG